MNTNFEQAIEKAIQLSLQENYKKVGESEVVNNNSNNNSDNEDELSEDENWVENKSKENSENEDWSKSEWDDRPQSSFIPFSNPNEEPNEGKSKSNKEEADAPFDYKKVKPKSPSKEPPRRGMKLVTVVKNGGWVTQEWR